MDNNKVFLEKIIKIISNDKELEKLLLELIFKQETKKDGTILVKYSKGKITCTQSMKVL